MINRLLRGIGRNRPAELQAPRQTPPPLAEWGGLGLEEYSGFIRQAYTSELYWPTVAPLYNRIWRSDPEVTIVRSLFDALSGQLALGWQLPAHAGGIELDDPSDDDQRALEFAYSVLEDIEGGINDWMTGCMTRVPFYGWGWWEAVPGIRKTGWRPPDNDPWRSQYDDGLVGYRRLAFRQYNSFSNWETDANGRLLGMHQSLPQGRSVYMPVERSLHITYGDRDNPEGLASMEAMWRLERIKYGLEIIQGIGYEHAAGHVKFKADKQLSDSDKTIIRNAARAVLTAQEGNYMALPAHIDASVMDVPFSAAPAILEAIRYYGILKLSLFGMQFVAISATSGTGSYAALSDASSLALTLFNSMAEQFVEQADQQIGKRLFEYPSNKAAFPGLTRRPRLFLERKVEKEINLLELAQFAQAMAAIMPLTEDDFMAIRRKSSFLPEINAEVKPSEPEPEPDEDESVSTETPDGEMQPDGSPEPEAEDGEDEQAEDAAEMATKRPFVPGPDEQPTDVTHEASIGEKDIQRAMRRFETWAEKNAPGLSGILRAKVTTSKDKGKKK